MGRGQNPIKYLLLFALVLCSGLLAEDLRIDQIVAAHMTVSKIPGLGLGIIHGNKIVYLKGYGKEHIALRRDVDPSVTRFRWASLSKTVTGILAVKAHLRGYLDLDADIRTYYPQYVLPSTYMNHGVAVDMPTGTHVTLRQLLSHSAGMQHYSNGKSSPTPPYQLTNNELANTGMEWALKYWVSNPLISFPGDSYHYSTPSFNLAGVVLEKALGENFANLTEHWIASPSKITTLRPDTLWNMAPHRAEGYIAVGTNFVLDADNDVSWKLAGGGFISTTEDLSRYALAVMGEDFLTPAEKALLWTKTKLNNGSTISYGVGWNVYTTADGHKKVSHSGSQEKARARLNLYPEEGLGFAILTNAGHDVNLSALAKQLEDTVRERLANGEGPIIEKAEAISSLDIPESLPRG
ncbi:MAG: beta-lactamase family protein [Bdellovibrionaceae bacterium]|nr:beta-lactamase family protein [Bdellovibrionales bacterium]MCB9253135.1 beta-lactamase family protein [Pseudobdellovibrionaceae bacterium]